jgi:diguanylate cyclase (GGDEF)-like protein
VKRKSVNRAVVDNFKPETANPHRAVCDEALAHVLQTTLVTSELIERFCSRLQASVPHHGYSFTNERFGLEIRDGYRANHRCRYELVADGENLGELTLTRRTRFVDDELAKLEETLAWLVYPLRNSLLYRQALQAAHTDPLTGVQNRTALEASLRRECELARRHGTPLSVILLDADHFKAINDTFGHAAGDQVLCTLATCIKNTVRASDIVFRYGGEEFVILLSNTAGHGAACLAERIRRAIADLVCTFDGKTLAITVSLGVASLEANENVENLLRRGDESMYRAKREGRNRVVADR